MDILGTSQMSDDQLISLREGKSRSHKIREPKTYHKICKNPNCKTDFDTNIKSQKYCTQKCLSKMNNKRMKSYYSKLKKGIVPYLRIRILK